MKRLHCFLHVIAVITMTTFMSATAANVTVNLATEYQTVEGFGGFGPQKVWWGGAPFYTPAWINYMIVDLGLTLLRDEIHSGYEGVNENSDPAVMDLTKFQPSTSVTGVDATLMAHVPFWKAMQMKADSLNEPLRLLGSVWSPPAWMKKSGSVRGTIADAPNPATTQCALKDDAITWAEFGEFLAAWVKLVKQLAGVDVYAVSIQNEPAFEEPYAACVYGPTKYREVLKVVGKRFELEGLSQVKFVGPEDVTATQQYPKWIDTICADTLARRYLHATAIHGYMSNGITPQSPGATDWAKFGTKAKQYGKQVWMTETGASGDWAGALNGGTGIFNGLKYGGLTGWTWWYTCDNLFTSGTTPNKAFYVLKQYTRFVRPDSKRVEATCDDTAIGVVAFHHKTNNCISIVFLNKGNAAKTVSITGTGLPAEFKVFRSSATENCVDLGTMAATSISLPASSMTTVVSGKYIGSKTATAIAPAPRMRSKVLNMRTLDKTSNVVIFNLRGQSTGMNVTQTGMGAAGVYCARVGKQGSVRVMTGR